MEATIIINKQFLDLCTTSTMNDPNHTFSELIKQTEENGEPINLLFKTMRPLETPIHRSYKNDYYYSSLLGLEEFMADPCFEPVECVAIIQFLVTQKQEEKHGLKKDLYNFLFLKNSDGKIEKVDITYEKGLWSVWRESRDYSLEPRKYDGSIHANWIVNETKNRKRLEETTTLKELLLDKVASEKGVGKDNIYYSESIGDVIHYDSLLHSSLYERKREEDVLNDEVAVYVWSSEKGLTEIAYGSKPEELGHVIERYYTNKENQGVDGEASEFSHIALVHSSFLREGYSLYIYTPYVREYHKEWLDGYVSYD